MKFTNYIKNELRTTVKMLPLLAIQFLLVPIVYSFFLAFTNSNLFSPTFVRPEIKVAVEVVDQHELTQQVAPVFLEALAAEKIIVQVDQPEDAVMTLTFKEGFGEALRNGENRPLLELSTKPGASVRDITIMENILRNWTGAFLKQSVIQQQVTARGLSAEASRQLQEALQAQASPVAYHNEAYVGPTALTSMQYFSVASVGYLFLMLFTGVLAANVKSDFKGLHKRMKLAPMNVRQRVLYESGSQIIIYFPIILLYLGVWKLIDRDTFSGNILSYLFIMFVWTVTVVAISRLASLFVKEEAIGGISSMLSMVFVFFSGMLPLDRMGDSELFKWLASNPIKQMVTNPLLVVQQGGDFSGYLLPYGIALLVAVICIMLTIRISQAREEYVS